MRMFYLAIVFVSLTQAAVLDRVAVVVGSDVITEGEVLQELRLEEFTASEPLDLSAEKRRAAAGRLADQQLIRQDIQTTQYQGPGAGEVDAMLRNFRSQHFRSDAELHAALQKYGITEDELKQYLLWQLTVLRFTDWRFGGLGQVPAQQAADGAAPRPSSDRVPAGIQEADRAAASSGVPGAPPAVDERMDAWLKQARATTRIDFKPEAFR
jgi:hypothetical protein